MTEKINLTTNALIRELIYHIGDNPDRPGLQETPERVRESYSELFSGYLDNPKRHLKIFEDIKADEIVLLRGYEFFSTCEHHLLPFFGQAHIGYIPENKVLGLSKLGRIFDCFSRRLQVQERLTTQVANFLYENLEAKAVGVVVVAKHFCMCARGVNKQHSEMVTSSMCGAFREKPEARAEFLSLLKI